ncbi:MAG TPA: hypothetical protein PK668_18005 [Myxococcota bacterium]|nr:hypothetical protein [Myxococcota bacterium]HRY95857.1 hypothetical protein [Myxococcota bacterium]
MVLHRYAWDLVGSSTDLEVSAVEEAVREGCLHIGARCNLPFFSDCRARNCAEESDFVFYVACLGLFANDRWQAAYDCFRKLPAEGCFARIAKDKIARCVEQLTKFHRAESLAYEQAGRLWKALEHELTLFELHPCDPEIYARLRGLEQRVEVPAGRERPRIAWDQAACGNPP